MSSNRLEMQQQKWPNMMSEISEPSLRGCRSVSGHAKGRKSLLRLMKSKILVIKITGGSVILVYSVDFPILTGKN